MPHNAIKQATMIIKLPNREFPHKLRTLVAVEMLRTFNRLLTLHITVNAGCMLLLFIAQVILCISCN